MFKSAFYKILRLFLEYQKLEGMKIKHFIQWLDILTNVVPRIGSV